jgi:hypothetical protein
MPSRETQLYSWERPASGKAATGQDGRNVDNRTTSVRPIDLDGFSLDVEEDDIFSAPLSQYDIVRDLYTSHSPVAFPQSSGVTRSILGPYNVVPFVDVNDLVASDEINASMKIDAELEQWLFNYDGNYGKSLPDQLASPGPISFDKTKRRHSTEDGIVESRGVTSSVEEKPAKERKRLLQACTACRRKKVRCSGERPTCKCCQRTSMPCVYKSVARQPAPRLGYMAMLERRLRRMEDRIIRLNPRSEQDELASKVPRAIVQPSTTSKEQANPRYASVI